MKNPQLIQLVQIVGAFSGLVMAASCASNDQINNELKSGVIGQNITPSGDSIPEALAFKDAVPNAIARYFGIPVGGVTGQTAGAPAAGANADLTGTWTLKNVACYSVSSRTVLPATNATGSSSGSNSTEELAAFVQGGTLTLAFDKTKGMTQTWVNNGCTVSRTLTSASGGITSPQQEMLVIANAPAPTANDAETPQSLFFQPSGSCTNSIPITFSTIAQETSGPLYYSVNGAVNQLLLYNTLQADKFCAGVAGQGSVVMLFMK